MMFKIEDEIVKGINQICNCFIDLTKCRSLNTVFVVLFVVKVTQIAHPYHLVLQFFRNSLLSYILFTLELTYGNLGEFYGDIACLQSILKTQKLPCCFHASNKILCLKDKIYTFLCVLYNLRLYNAKIICFSVSLPSSTHLQLIILFSSLCHWILVLINVSKHR